MKIKNLILLAPLVLVAPLAAQEESKSGPDLSQQLIEVLPSIFERAIEVLQQPWEGNINIDVTTADMNLSGVVECSFYHSRMFSFDLNMEIGEGDTAQEISGKIVADDSFLNMEFVTPGGDPSQAFKLQLDFLEELQGDQGMAMQGLPAGFDPSEIITLVESMGLKEEVSADGKTSTVVFDLSKLDIGEMASEMKGVNCEMSFNTKTAFPSHFSIAKKDLGSLSLTFSEVSVSLEIDESKYTYKPGEGVFPMDMTGMLRMQMQAAQGGFDEEF